ncbi:MAG: helix-turn-helix domain-containing protein [Bacillota bacterium]
MVKKKNMLNVWDIIDTIASEETKELFALDDILYKIAMSIYDYRQENNLTQKQLAQKLNIKQSMISKLESGEYNPTVEQLWKICNKLGWKLSISFENNVSIHKINSMQKFNIKETCNIYKEPITYPVYFDTIEANLNPDLVTCAN